MDSKIGEHDWILDIIFGIIFAWMVYKVITLLLNFKEDNLSIVRSRDDASEIESKIPMNENYFNENPVAKLNNGLDNPSPSNIKPVNNSKDKDLILKQDDDDDIADESSEGDLSEDEWESIEEKKVGFMFEAASLFIETVAQGSGHSINQEFKLLLYALYKQSTVGPCDTPKPSIFNLEKKAKWEAWHQLGEMTREEAMDNYVDLVYHLFPDTFRIDEGSIENQMSEKMKSKHSTGMGPVFSTMMHDDEEENSNESPSPELHYHCRNGDEDKVVDLLKKGLDINEKDENGCTPLHIASDSGNLKIVNMLLDNGCDIDAKDSEGQTPLFYACICEHESIASLLLTHGASVLVTDEEGKTPSDYFPSNWNFPM